MPEEDPAKLPSPVQFLSEDSEGAFPWATRLGNLAIRVLQHEQRTGICNAILCSDATLRGLNKEFRKLDKVTDVLSFPWDSPGFLGEIYISRPQVWRQAPQYGNTPYRELQRVFLHGLLHLLGYDHLRPSERKIMRSREEFFLGNSPYHSPTPSRK